MSTGPTRSPSLQAAFEEYYARYSQEVWAVGYARLLNRDQALDLMQEAFLRLWKHGLTGEVIVNVRAWLLRVVRNLAEDQAKSSFRRNGTQSHLILESIASRVTAPLEKAEAEETVRLVRGELAQMAVSDREILTLRYALEYSTDRMAETLGVNAAAVHMRLSRARERLGKRLANMQPEA
jgi:RNA polymerase sigma-70 factor, ECF subfamily